MKYRLELLNEGHEMPVSVPPIKGKAKMIHEAKRLLNVLDGLLLN